MYFQTYFRPVLNLQIIPYCKKSKKNKNGDAPIYFVLRINSIDKLISTGKNVHVDYFNNDKEKIMPGHQNSRSFNAYLNAEKYKLEKIILDLQNDEKLITHQTIIDTGGQQKGKMMDVKLDNLGEDAIIHGKVKETAETNSLYLYFWNLY